VQNLFIDPPSKVHLSSYYILWPFLDSSILIQKISLFFTDEVEGALSRRRTAGLDLEDPQNSFGKVYAEADRFL